MLLLCTLFFLHTSLLDVCLANGWKDLATIKEDLQNLNATCPSDKNCTGNLSFSFADCDCEIFCTRLGTCCADSPYLNLQGPKIKPSCRATATYDTGILMIDRCPRNGKAENAYDDLCRQEDNDLMRLVPVTSLFTHNTYKNYFCFLCHESNDDYVFWQVEITYDGHTDVQYDDPGVHVFYDENHKTWVAPVAKGGEYAPVTLNYVTPSHVYSIPKSCKPSLLTECSEYWPDDEVRMKCNAYLQPTTIERDDTVLNYKNPHCSLCNYENLQNRKCTEPGGGGAFAAGKRPFSFTFLLDINRSDGDKVGLIDRCSDGEVWDPFYKKCRTLKCALPGYVVKDGRCVEP